MVLQDPGNTPPEGFNDSSYPSDNNDAYSSASASTSTRRFPYDPSGFSQPIPLLGPVLGFSEGMIRWRIEDTLKFAEKKISRPLRPEECQALASHLYGAESTRSYTSAVGLAVGIWRWRATTPVNGLPLHTPKPESIDPNKFLFLRGQLAQTARHSVRFGLWTTFMTFVGSFLGGMYAQPIAARAAAEDPRLEELKSVVKSSLEERAQQAQKARQDRAQQAGGSGAQGLPPHAGAPGAPRAWTRTPPPPTSAPAITSDDDDMSPTGGNEPWPTSGSFQTDSSFSSDSANTQQRQPRAQVPQQARQQRQPRQQPIGFDDDDASPTGGLFQEETKSQSNESAWERLRRGGPPPSQGSSYGRERREESSGGETWTSQETDDEAKRERMKAQREFDERLERERQGKDFSDERKW